MTTNVSQKSLEQLIPIPTPLSLPLVPTPWPGISPESAKAVAELLRENHVKYHCFFNDDGFHNHLPHHLLAAYALGCTPTLLKAAYDLHAEYQREQKPSRSEITEQNWKEHLGKPAYYPAYLQFFQDNALQKGMSATLEKYIFSSDANDGKSAMFARFFSGLLHPLIHFGHGPEFGLPGLAAEGTLLPESIPSDSNILLLGLAMAAVTKNICTDLFPPEFFQHDAPASPGPHALSIAARILNDPELAYGKGADPESNARFQSAIQRSSKRLNKYFNEWSPEGDFVDKYEELMWLATSIYGFSGWRKSEEFKANFFMRVLNYAPKSIRVLTSRRLHLVTSSLFLPSIHSLLTPASGKLLLRGFLAVSLTYWVGHNRPSFTIDDFFAAELVVPPHTDPKPADDALDAPHLNQNPWFPILQSALNHPDEHLLKVQRSFAHYAGLYGTRAKGCLAQTELPEAAAIDGSLFLRLASVTGQAKAWVREGEPSHDANWNRRY